MVLYITFLLGNLKALKKKKTHKSVCKQSASPLMKLK